MTSWRHPDAWEGPHVWGAMCEQQFVVTGLQEHSHPDIHPTLHYLRRKAISPLLVQVVDGTERWVLVEESQPHTLQLQYTDSSLC